MLKNKGQYKLNTPGEAVTVAPLIWRIRIYITQVTQVTKEVRRGFICPGLRFLPPAEQNQSTS